ncbi:MAG: ZIP family metal transporter [Candidatus Peribacteraceae bacterium]|nr:ZIP family metal transporter [Candidatus Peribacteraceae bacterium]
MEHQILLYAFSSIFFVSIISLIGVVIFSLHASLVKHWLIPFVSLSAGTLLGAVFLHMIPEMAENHAAFHMQLVLILTGIAGSFLLEKLIHWRHCHDLECRNNIHPVGMMNVIGDGVHNFLDGILIAGSFLVSVPMGIATTTAVVFHEIPQEIGDFAVLLYSGYSKRKALFLNFLSAITAFLGAALVLVTSGGIPNIETFLLPIAAGNFLYIAGTDLMPELHKETGMRRALVQFVLLITGMMVIYAMTTLFHEPHTEEYLDATHTEEAAPLTIN